MIAYLSGVVREKSLEQVIIDVNGVGYGVFVSAEDHGRLATDAPAKVHIYEHVREQSYDLFGFTDQSAKQLFEQLLNVNGIGPKMALNILSIGSSKDVRQAIAGGDVKYLQAASGIGKRVAERVVVELRDKVGLVAGIGAEDMISRGTVDSGDEAIQALIALGYNEFDARTALKNIDKTLPTEERIKRALKT